MTSQEIAKFFLTLLESYEVCETYIVSRSPKKKFKDREIDIKFLEGDKTLSIDTHLQITHPPRYNLDFSHYVSKYDIDLPMDVYAIPDGISHQSIITSEHSQSGIFFIEEKLKSDPNNLVSLGLVYLLKLPDIVVQTAKELPDTEEVIKDLFRVIYNTDGISDFYCDNYDLDDLTCDNGHLLLPCYKITTAGKSVYGKVRTDGFYCEQCNFQTKFVDLQKTYHEKIRNAPLAHEFGDLLDITKQIDD